MEIRDLYDENKILTGETILKGEEVPKGRYYITVLVFIENSKNELLLQVNKKYNMWSTTGGHPKSGENSLNGIVTEIKEELGIDVNPKNLSLIKTYKTEDDFVDMYYLKKDIYLEEMITQESEVGSINWFSKTEIDKLIKNNKLLPSHIEFYKDFLKLVNKKNKYFYMK